MLADYKADSSVCRNQTTTEKNTRHLSLADVKRSSESKIYTYAPDGDKGQGTKGCKEIAAAAPAWIVLITHHKSWWICCVDDK